MVIEKLKQADLKGRGGAGFPVWQKWDAVKKSQANKKYIICNASEGEPGVAKDGFILNRYPASTVEGVKIALDEIDNSEAIIYLRKDYYKRFGPVLNKFSKGLPIKLFEKKGGYLCGEETTLLEAIEGHLQEPRNKPPYPVEFGLFGCPTIINNLETFYFITEIIHDRYENTRFYTIGGVVNHPGVYELPVDWTISKILQGTENFPKTDFFVQAGGGMSGKIFTKEELQNNIVGGLGAITVYDQKKTKPLELMKKWINFFYNENCGKCVPCREGTYRIKEILQKDKIDEKALKDILFVLEKTSFCPFGKNIFSSFDSLLTKIWPKK